MRDLSNLDSKSRLFSACFCDFEHFFSGLSTFDKKRKNILGICHIVEKNFLLYHWYRNKNNGHNE